MRIWSPKSTARRAAFAALKSRTSGSRAARWAVDVAKSASGPELGRRAPAAATASASVQRSQSSCTSSGPTRWSANWALIVSRYFVSDDGAPMSPGRSAA